jgi:agmatine deiminase
MKSLVWAFVLPHLVLLVFSPGAFAEVTRRVPAEFGPQDSIWMQWPKGIERSYRPDFASIIDVLQQYETINIIVDDASARTQAQNYLGNRGVPLTNINWHLISYDWAWLRDNGPVWVEVDGVLTAQDWVFDGWGGEVPDVTYWDQDDAVPCQIAAVRGDPCESYAVVNERGTLEFNGVDTLINSWPVMHDRNPSWTMAQFEELFEQAFGVTQVIWLLSSPASDQITGGHVDGIARFISADTVVVNRFADQSHPDAPVYEEAAQIIANAGFNVLRLNIPGAVNYKGATMDANYINWLVVDGAVITTGFGNSAWDDAAKAEIEAFFPDREVHVVETLEIWYWGGGVHCVTNDVPIPVPEPSRWLMLFAGVLGLGAFHRFRLSSRSRRC